MNIDHLREFVYLAETLNFRITAQHFYISQSVLSKHIGALEETLGIALFERDRHHVALTALGRVFYDDCTIVLNDYDHALAHIAAATSGEPLCVRIGYLRGASQPFISKFVTYMERHRPDVKLVLTCMEYGELIKAHRSHMVDIVFTLNLDPEARDVCDSFPLYRDQFYAVVGKGHALAARTGGIRREELRGQRLLLPRESLYPGLAEFLCRFVPQGHRAADDLLYGDVDTMRLLLQRNDCVGFSSGHFIESSKSSFSFLPLIDADTSYDVSAIWLKDANPVLVEACRPGMEACRLFMKSWDDGHAMQFTG